MVFVVFVILEKGGWKMLVSSKVIERTFGKSKYIVKHALYIACLGCGNICRETLTIFEEGDNDFFKTFIRNYKNLGLVHKYCCICSRIRGSECRLCERRKK